MRKGVKVLCLYQLFRLEYRISKRGCGDCTTCIPDKDNMFCRCYIPVDVYILRIGGEKCDHVEDG